ncbi:MAG: L-lactate dehydrogenase [Bifidobacteriaceae bacterium]|jgi:L-lactate dehydrogenase|nr:L-lactate dehydrogenase [Bifidobacteriaceae bacterium]
MAVLLILNRILEAGYKYQIKFVLKISIIGAGAVGSTIVFALAQKDLARQIVLYDINGQKAEAEALDMIHGSQFLPTNNIIGTDDIQALINSDIIIVTAGATQKDGQTRLDLAQATCNIMKSLLPKVVSLAPEAIYIMVANPVDLVTYYSLKITGLSCHKMFGSGTVLDSSRLRTLVAEFCQVSVKNVHAYVVGEHGDSEIPLWSSAVIAGINLLNWGEVYNRPALTDAIRDNIKKEVINAGYEVIKGKGATNYAIALSCTEIVSAIVHDEKRIMPVSTRLQKYLGISDVCLSVPSILSRQGVDTRVNIPFSDDEKSLLVKSAQTLKKAFTNIAI